MPCRASISNFTTSTAYRRAEVQQDQTKFWLALVTLCLVNVAGSQVLSSQVQQVYSARISIGQVAPTVVTFMRHMHVQQGSFQPKPRKKGVPVYYCEADIWNVLEVGCSVIFVSLQVYLFTCFMPMILHTHMVCAEECPNQQIGTITPHLQLEFRQDRVPTPVHVVASGADVERVTGKNMVLAFIASERNCAKVLGKLAARVQCTIHNGMVQSLTMQAME